MARASIVIVGIGVAGLALAGCGDRRAPAPIATATTARSIEATPTGADDAVIARVDGRPVYGSCVAAQMARGLERRAALDECVAFELLAGAAAARHLDRDPAVIEAERTERVNRFVDAEFIAKVRSAADLPAELLDRAVQLKGYTMQQPLRRVGVYVRASLPKGTVEGSPEERAARALVDDIHATLAGRRGLFPVDLFTTGEHLARTRGMKVDHETKPYATAIDQDADEHWRAALFAVPEIGMVSAATRTQWGWDVVLWVDTIPARNLTRDQFFAELFPDLRRAYFGPWTKRIGRDLHVEVHADRLQALVDAEREDSAPPPTTPPPRSGR